MKKLLFALVGIVIFSSSSFAHDPTEMALEYNQDSQSLNVVVGHITHDEEDHIIRTISFYKGEELLKKKYFKEQLNRVRVKTSFSIDQESAMGIKVVAKCSRGGVIESVLEKKSEEVETKNLPVKSPKTKGNKGSY